MHERIKALEDRVADLEERNKWLAHHLSGIVQANPSLKPYKGPNLTANITPPSLSARLS